PKINIYMGLVTRILRLRHVPNISGLGRSFLGGGLMRAATLLAYRVSLNRCEAVFFQNQSDLDLFVSSRLVREEQAKLIPGSGIDLARFHPDLRQAPADSDRFVFLMVGRLLIDKGLLEYAQAAAIIKARNPEVVFRLAGRFDPSHPSSVPGN